MKTLPSATIARLAARKGVRAVAVQNFLSSLDGDAPRGDAYGNLRADAASHGWNAATVRAIDAGIDALYSAPKAPGRTEHKPTCGNGLPCDCGGR